MQLTVIGSGTAHPHPKRSSAGFWLEMRAGTMLLDCSASAIHRMAEERLPWAGLDVIWISHFHLDHVGGVAPFLFGIRHAKEVADRTKPLIICGHRGLRGLLEAFDAAGQYHLFDQKFPVEILELEAGDTFSPLPGVNASTFKTPHKPQSLAIRLDSPEGSLCYTSDTGFERGLGEFASGVGLFIVESSFPKEKTVTTHLEFSEALELISIAEPGKALVTHLYPQWDDVNVNDLAEGLIAPCEVILAFDGLKISV